MAMSTTTSKKSLSHIPLVAIIITIHLMPLLLGRVNSQDSLFFSYNSFKRDDSSLILQGDASYSSTGALQLTKVDNKGNPLSGSVGRALYSCPVRLYDKSTRRVSIIHTSFSIEISGPSPTVADGLTFFFAPVDHTFPANSGGAFLGLFSADRLLNNSRNEVIGFRDSPDNVVAVEFDTYPNADLGDPRYRHIGIDVNSIVSVKTASWEWQNGKRLHVNVVYDPFDKTLRVSASHLDGSEVDFTHEIDLPAVLPEWVKVGFSASTGLYSQVNNVRSWTYNSLFMDISAGDERAGIASVV